MLVSLGTARRERTGIAPFVSNSDMVQQCFITNEPYVATKQGVENKTMLVSSTGFDLYDDVLFTTEAARRWTGHGIVATCFFPGLVQTRFARGSLLFTLARPLPIVVTPPAQGADTLVWLATAGEALVPGGYFAFRAPFGASPRSTDPDRARRLWDASLGAVGL